MVMAVLSRDSVREAFKNGITADQIILFLTSHAHAEMRKQVRRIIAFCYQVNNFKHDSKNRHL